MAATMAINMHSQASPQRRSPSLSIDLSDLPPLSQPSPPSNTLLITNLQSLEIFTSTVLENITQAINDQAPIHTFAPLKSFRRIVVSFYSTNDALKVRQLLDGENVLGNRIRVYFGQNTRIDTEDQHLQAPKSSKLFFISPPPSPPMGWEMRNEEPPNKEVHAEDLAIALANLHTRPSADEALHTQADGSSSLTAAAPAARTGEGQRSRSSTLVYHPGNHGDSPHLPAIAVEDTSETPGDMSPVDGLETKFPHTARPPVELMAL